MAPWLLAFNCKNQCGKTRANALHGPILIFIIMLSSIASSYYMTTVQCRDVSLHHASLTSVLYGARVATQFTYMRCELLNGILDISSGVLAKHHHSDVSRHSIRPAQIYCLMAGRVLIAVDATARSTCT